MNATEESRTSGSTLTFAFLFLSKVAKLRAKRVGWVGFGVNDEPEISQDRDVGRDAVGQPGKGCAMAGDAKSCGFWDSGGGDGDGCRG